MSISLIVAILIWVIGILAFFFLLPHSRIREFLMVFFTCQSLLWCSSLIHVHLHLLAFPMREFPKATHVLVTTEFFFYPLLCGFYLIHEPKRSRSIRFVHLFLWVSVVVIIDKLLEKFTHLIEYVHYTWYFNWIVFFFIFALTNLIVTWFFKGKEELRKEQEAVQ